MPRPHRGNTLEISGPTPLSLDGTRLVRSLKSFSLNTGIGRPMQEKVPSLYLFLYTQKLGVKLGPEFLKGLARPGG